jgi:uncharacterized protein (DUF362 family)
VTPSGGTWNLDRRTFLRLLSLAGLTGLTYSGKGFGSSFASSAPADLSRVVIVTDSGATSGLTINASVVQSMIDCGVMNLTGIFNVGEAWKSLFPGITASSVVAIKVNCINSPLSTHPGVANAIASGIAQIDFDGTLFPANNVIIFDRTNWELINAGYTINTSTTGVRCFGTDQSGVGYNTTYYDVAGSSQRLSKIVTNTASYLVNASCMKNHGEAGVTFCLKNHYGTCNNPGGLHGGTLGECDPYIPALNALTPIRSKQCVNICDALFGIYSGGPSGNPQFVANSILMSQDIVALDYCAREILADHGCTTIEAGHHIDTAAGAPYSLGTNDPDQMDVVTLANPSAVEPVRPDGGGAVRLRQNSPNPFGAATDISFYLEREQPVRLEVFDARGRSVCSLAERSFTAGWHQAHWDGRTSIGEDAASGVYFCRLSAGAVEKAIAMQLVR